MGYQMYNAVWFYFLVFLIAIGFPVSLPAQITLQEAVETALELNRELIAVRHNAKASTHGIWEAKSAYLPQVSFNSESSNSESELFEFEAPDLPPALEDVFTFDNVGGFTGEVFTNQFQFSQLVFDRSVLGEITLSELRDEAAQWQEIGQEQQVVFDTIAAFMDVLRANELLEVQQQRLKLAEKQLDTAQTNFEVGMRIRTDVLRAELTRSSAMRDIVSAEIARDQAIVAFNEIIGIRVNANRELQNTMLVEYNPPEEMLNQLKQYDRLFDIAETKNPAIKVAALVLQQQDEAVAIAKGEFYPRARIGGSWGFRENELNFEEEEWRIFAAIDVPIFEGGRRVAKMRRTKEERSAQSRRLEDTIRMVQRSVEQSALAVQEEFRNLQIAIEAEKVARENQARFQNLYQEGLADTLDVTQSITELVEAQTDVVTTRYDYMILMARLLLAMGIISIDSNAYTGVEWLDYANLSQPIDDTLESTVDSTD